MKFSADAESEIKSALLTFGEAEYFIRVSVFHSVAISLVPKGEFH